MLLARFNQSYQPFRAHELVDTTTIFNTETSSKKQDSVETNMFSFLHKTSLNLHALSYVQVENVSLYSVTAAL